MVVRPEDFAASGITLPPYTGLANMWVSRPPERTIRGAIYLPFLGPDSKCGPEFDAHWLRQVQRHELSRVVGLGHVDNPVELMYSAYVGQTGFGPGDLAGLRRLGLGNVNCNAPRVK